MTVFRYIAMGGWFIYPLVFLSVILVTVAIERALFFSRLQKRYGLLELKLEKRESSPSLSRYFEHIEELGKVSDKNSLLELFLEEEFHENTRHFGMLAFIAATSPLFGLLGTIAGIMTLFRKIELVGYNTDPSMLSGGIWQAIITTLTGLVVAIPAIGLLQYFDHRNQKSLLVLKRIFARERNGSDKA